MKRFALVAVAVGALLAGCASPSIDSKTSDSLATAVVAVAEQASAGQLSRALTRLDAVQSQLDEGVESGAVSEEKASSIQAAIDVVRADLDEMLAKAVADREAAEAQKAEEAAEAERVAQEKAAAAEAAKGDKPGKGKGKGKKK